MPVYNTPDVVANPEADLQFLADKLLQKQQDQVVEKLSEHISTVWTQVKEDNKQIRIETVKLLRRVKGEYDPVKLQAIKAFQGSEVYIRSAETKARAAESWISDIYRGDNDLPWELKPTAVPTLPDETRAQILDEINHQGLALQQQEMIKAQQTGIPADPARIAATMNEWTQMAQKKATEQVAKDAKIRCDKASQKIRDENQEGGWNKAFSDFLWYFIRAKVGIIKGPIMVKKKRQAWKPDGNGGFVLATEEVIGSDCYCVSPFNFYPSRGMTDSNNGNICEVHELTRQSLSDLIGSPGYSEQNIKKVLADWNAGSIKGKWLQIEDETDIKKVEREKNNTSNLDTLPANTIQALEFYGSVSGQLLSQWMESAGMPTTGIDVSQEYQANCWKIGNVTIKAVINPDELGRKPYHVTSWAKNPATIIGEGLIEFCEAVEDILNSIARALQNNIAIASGPMVEINSDRCDDRTPIYPWKRTYSTTSQMKDGPAVSYYQPQMHVQELIAAYTFFARLLDEMTVPAYAQGASQSGVTNGTATVFTELLKAATRSIKAGVSNIDNDIITSYMQMSYDNLMKFSDDPELKGDANVVANGVTSLLAKEQQAQRKVEFLQVAANPVFAQTLGAKNIGSILAQIAKSNDIVLPDLDRLEGEPTIQELLTKMNLQMAGVDPGGAGGAQATGQIGAGGTPTNPQEMNAAGAPAGAPEFQQPAQVA